MNDAKRTDKNAKNESTRLRVRAGVRAGFSSEEGFPH
jgi:hypothetical protein